MKRIAYAAVMLLAAGVMVAPAMADNHEDGDAMFKVHGEVRSRMEWAENYDYTDVDNDANVVWPYRVRVGVHGQFSDKVGGYIELQGNGAFGDTAGAFTSQDPLFQYGFIDSELSTSINLYQAFIDLDEIGGSAIDLRIGRQEITAGNELMFGDNDYYNGLVFDGITGGWDFENWDLGLRILKVLDAGNLFQPCQVDCGNTDVDLYSLDASFEIGDTAQMVEPYVIYADVPEIFLGDAVKFATIGARYGRAVDLEDDNLLDWNVELAYQTGDVGDTGDHTAYILESWIGFNFGTSRVQVGYLSTSGDDDANDGDNESFQPLFADIHANNRLGNIDFGGRGALSGALGMFISGSPLGVQGDTGVTDISVSYTGMWGRHGLLLGLHLLSATEDANLPNNEDDLGQMVDVAYDFMYSKNLSFGVEVSQYLVGDLHAQIDPDWVDDTIRVAAQARLRW